MDITRKDILLLLFYAPGINKQFGESINGVTKLTKLLYLLKKIYKIDKYIKKYYSFEAHKLGPFTREIYDDLDFFENLGFLESKTRGPIQLSEFYAYEEFYENSFSGMDLESISQDTYQDVEFRLSSKGHDFAKKMYPQVPNRINEACKEIKIRFGYLSLNELLKYVYQKFPNMAKRTIRKDLLIE